MDKVASERDVLKSKNESLEAMETELTDQVCYLFIYLINHCIWWFSVGVCKYKPGYNNKSHDQLYFNCSHWLKLQHSDWRTNLGKDLKEKKISPMRALEFVTGRVMYDPAYT